EQQPHRSDRTAGQPARDGGSTAEGERRTRPASTARIAPFPASTFTSRAALFASASETLASGARAAVSSASLSVPAGRGTLIEPVYDGSCCSALGVPLFGACGDALGLDDGGGVSARAAEPTTPNAGAAVVARPARVRSRMVCLLCVGCHQEVGGAT